MADQDGTFFGNPATVSSGTVEQEGLAFSGAALNNGPLEVPSYIVINSLGGSEVDSYRMRARDTSLGRLVYWNSRVIDLTGAFYQGPGPLTDIVLQLHLGANPKVS